MKVMPVEDNPLIALSFEAILHHDGHRVMGPFATATEVFRAVRHERPDLVLMDIELHGRPEGLDCARVLLQRHRIPVLFISGDADKARQGYAVAVGYIIKPMPEATLAASVRAVEAVLQGEVPRQIPPDLTLFRSPAVL